MRKEYMAPIMEIIAYCETDICSMSLPVSGSEGSDQFANEQVFENIWE